MKKFLRVFFSGCVFLAVTLSSGYGQNIPPRPQQYVNDYAGILSSVEEQQAESLSMELARKADAHLIVVTIQSARPDTIEQYAVRLFEQWGIGDKRKDNGVLLLVAVNDREVRIEAGYGLEGVLTDAMSRSIIERFIVPAFRQQQYGPGVMTGTAAIASLIAGSQGVTVTGREQQVAQALQRSENGESGAGFFIFLILMILFILNPRLFMYMMLFNMLGGRGGRGYWSGGSSGGFGGGFGGFGGGMSGGGGATGRW
ncbi:MAG: TPM domain-containing protein [Candidatus Omnitrophota bacterium]